MDCTEAKKTKAGGALGDVFWSAMQAVRWLQASFSILQGESHRARSPPFQNQRVHPRGHGGREARLTQNRCVLRRPSVAFLQIETAKKDSWVTWWNNPSSEKREEKWYLSVGPAGNCNVSRHVATLAEMQALNGYTVRVGYLPTGPAWVVVERGCTRQRTASWHVHTCRDRDGWQDWVRRRGHQSIFGTKCATAKHRHQVLMHPTSSREIQIRNRWCALRRHA